jgi:enoyl-CoA hydratase/carnithine racemase
MSYTQILFEVRDRVATITLNRPEQLNAWTDVMADEVYQATHEADRDPDVRVLVLTGAGRAFCAGGDVTGFKGSDPRQLIDKLPRAYDFSRRADYQSRATYFPALSKPIIAMLNGATAGLGLVHALFCDLRFAADDAVVTTAVSRIGLASERARVRVRDGVDSPPGCRARACA